jgi:hypothetical protein
MSDSSSEDEELDLMILMERNKHESEKKATDLGARAQPAT